MAPEPFMDMAELAGLDAGIRDTPESADGASGAESGLADPMIEVRLPTSPAHSRQKAPRVGLEKVPDTGGQRTLLCCWTTRFFCPMPQDICLSRAPRTPDCPIHARARPRLPATQSMHLLPPRHVGGAEMPNDIFQNRLSRAGMCCPRRCPPSNLAQMPNPICSPHRVLSILPLPRTPVTLQDAAPARCVEEVVF